MLLKLWGIMIKKGGIWAESWLRVVISQLSYWLNLHTQFKSKSSEHDAQCARWRVCSLCLHAVQAHHRARAQRGPVWSGAVQLIRQRFISESPADAAKRFKSNLDHSSQFLNLDQQQRRENFTKLHAVRVSSTSEWSTWSGPVQTDQVHSGPSWLGSGSVCTALFTAAGCQKVINPNKSHRSGSGATKQSRTDSDGRRGH